ncbi:hypothetical protein SpCBS45565_g05665 [Spizellomyces sp. 'palustris']|nr:hypothetical protein SpCBS45565_g05665 [Spizellomyces sp. 'palustris']
MLSAELTSTHVEEALDQDVSRLWDILASCQQMAEDQPEVLNGLAFEDNWIWHIRPGISHPLCDAFGPKPFFLATKRREPFDEDTKVVALPLTRIDCLDVGPRHNDRTSYLSGFHSASSATCEWQIPPCRDMSTPIPTDDARHQPSTTTNTTQFLPIIILYHEPDDSGAPKKGYLGIEALPLQKGSQYKLYHLESSEGWVAKEAEQGCTPPPSVEAILEDCYDGFNLDRACDPLDFHISAKYDILSETLFKSSVDSPLSSIVMEVGWRGVQKLISSPPPSGHITVKIRNVFGGIDFENHLPTAPLLKELTKLMEWDGIRCRDDWPDSECELEGAQEARISSNLVDEWVKQIKDEGFVIGESSAESANTTFDLDASSALPPRPDLDFPERFWKFTHEVAMNRNDLAIALTAVIEELETGRLQPMVNKANHSSFARIIRDCYKLVRMQTAPDFDEQKEAISRTFDYWLEQPLELMVEIGIWKLKRDYFYHLIKNDVASWDQLDAFVDATLPLDEQVNRLRRLHRIVELWSLVKTNVLQMPTEGMRALVQAALEYYAGGSDEGETNCVDPTATVMYRLALPRFSSETGKALTGMVAGFEPSIWTLVVTPESSRRNHKYAAASSPAYMIQFDRLDGLFGDKAALSLGGNFDDDEMYKNIESLTEQLCAGANRWKRVRGVAR